MASDGPPLRHFDLLLLDTHVFIWLINDTGDLTRDVRQIVDRAAANRRVVVSVIAIWEIATLVRKDRLQLGNPTREWVGRALSHPGLAVHPLTPEIAVGSNELPRGIHGDPADRIMIATARALDATLVTRDKTILDYGARGHVDVLPA